MRRSFAGSIPTHGLLEPVTISATIETVGRDAERRSGVPEAARWSRRKRRRRQRAHGRRSRDFGATCRCARRARSPTGCAAIRLLLEQLETSSRTPSGMPSGQRRRRLHDVPRDEDDQVVGLKNGQLAGQHLVEDHPERIEIRARIDGVSLPLLGRHVLRRAEDRSDLRERLVARAFLHVDLGDAEIEHLHEIGQRPRARRAARCPA